MPRQINATYRWLQQITGGDFNVITALEAAAILHWQGGCARWDGGSTGAVVAGKHPEPTFPSLGSSL